MVQEADARDRALTGGCQCGAVRYALHAVPSYVSLCHCRMCQKAVGGPFMVCAVVALTDFSWTRGAPATWASSSVATRDFCAACGTPLAYRAIGGPNIELLAGTLDRPEQAAPVRQAGVESRLPWLDHMNSLPARTTADSIGPDTEKRVASRQHPDHDTPG